MIFFKEACLVLDQLVASTFEKIPSCQICQRFEQVCSDFEPVEDSTVVEGRRVVQWGSSLLVFCLGGWDQVKGGLDLLASLSPWW